MTGLVQRMDQFGSVQTFVKLIDGTDPDDVASKLLDIYCNYWDFYDRDASNGSFLYGSLLTRLDRMYFSGIDTYDIIRSGDKKTVEILLIVALVLLVSAIFNYINLTVAQAGKRAKEMAARRLLGESSIGILRRYICESFIFTQGCFAIGYVLAVCFRPIMNKLLMADILLRADYSSVIFSLTLICTLSMISGFLPALLVSKLKPVDVVKGNFRLRNKMVFSKVFIVCQNIICTILIAVAMTMNLQMKHLITLPIGYNTENLIELKTAALGYRNKDNQNELAERLRALPMVEAVGMYINTPLNCANNGCQIEDEKMSWIMQSALDSTCFKLLGFKVLEQYSEPLDGTYWFTEEAQKRYGITEQNRAVGKTDDGKPIYECCGIIADYRSHDALTEPMEDSHNAVMNGSPICVGLLIKVTGDQQEAFAAVADTWNKMAKEYLGIPKEADMKFYKDDMDSFLTGNRNTMMLVSIFMVLSILISTLGLFAMTVYYSDLQKKAISLHKVFGADTRQAALTLSRPFIITSLMAVAIATPISVWAMEYYIEGFYNRIKFPWWVLLVSVVVSLVVNALCLLFQTLKTANTNPVESIKTE